MAKSAKMTKPIDQIWQGMFPFGELSSKKVFLDLASGDLIELAKPSNNFFLLSFLLQLLKHLF
jgi:hypothetical protein